jgi:hypothetical protein
MCQTEWSWAKKSKSEELLGAIHWERSTSVYPGTHEHWYEPSVFSHSWWQYPHSRHSSLSVTYTMHIRIRIKMYRAFFSIITWIYSCNVCNLSYTWFLHTSNSLAKSLHLAVNNNLCHQETLCSYATYNFISAHGWYVRVIQIIQFLQWKKHYLLLSTCVQTQQQNQQAQRLINHKQNAPQDHCTLEMVPAVMHVFLAPL